MQLTELIFSHLVTHGHVRSRYQTTPDPWKDSEVSDFLHYSLLPNHFLSVSVLRKFSGQRCVFLGIHKFSMQLVKISYLFLVKIERQLDVPLLAKQFDKQVVKY